MQWKPAATESLHPKPLRQRVESDPGRERPSARLRVRVLAESHRVERPAPGSAKDIQQTTAPRDFRQHSTAVRERRDLPDLDGLPRVQSGSVLWRARTPLLDKIGIPAVNAVK